MALRVSTFRNGPRNCQRPTLADSSASTSAAAVEEIANSMIKPSSCYANLIPNSNEMTIFSMKISRGKILHAALNEIREKLKFRFLANFPASFLSFNATLKVRVIGVYRGACNPEMRFEIAVESRRVTSTTLPLFQRVNCGKPQLPSRGLYP